MTTNVINDITFIHVRNDDTSLKDAVMLFKQYVTELDENLCFQNFDQELENPLQKYYFNNGYLLVAYNDNLPVGCVALQQLQTKATCEMKRLFVIPSYRKFGVGKILIEKILDAAISLGYKTMKLDTLSRLESAIKLYKYFNFIDDAAYYSNPLPNVIYMKKELI